MFLSSILRRTDTDGIATIALGMSSWIQTPLGSNDAQQASSMVIAAGEARKNQLLSVSSYIPF